MKKLLLIALFSVICLSSVGCAKDNNDFCTSFEQIPFIINLKRHSAYYAKPVTKEYKLKEINYYRYCKLKPAIDNFQFSNQLGKKLELLLFAQTRDNTPVYETDKEAYDVIREITAYMMLNAFATIPQNVNQYRTIMKDYEAKIKADKAQNFDLYESMVKSHDKEFGDILLAINYYGGNEMIEKYIFWTFQQYEKNGAFNDYRVADIFIWRTLRIIELYEVNKFESLNNLKDMIIKIAKYNENKKKARITLEFLGEYFWNGSNYYKK